MILTPLHAFGGISKGSVGKVVEERQHGIINIC